MNHARKRSETATGKGAGRWALHAAVLLACGSMAVGEATLCAAPTAREAALIPTVHPTIIPTSAMPVPLLVQADQTNVWRSDLEQRMLASGHVVINVGFRSLHADDAAIWLTPSRESGESTWDVAIYLSGNVRVLEGGRPEATSTQGRELLVTTRLSRTIQLTGTPVSKAQEESPIVRRGQELRDELANRPMATLFIPQISVSTIEQALQSGWIAKGPNNRIVAGPGDFQLVKNSEGKFVPAPVAPKPAKPQPILRIAIDASSKFHGEQVGNEFITVYEGPYLIYDALDGKPPLVFHAQRAVTFSPIEKSAGATPAANKKSISQHVTGVYLEGDVSISGGQEDKIHSDESIHAERIYYDFTAQRAVMLDATVYTTDEKRNVPLYMRASKIRMLARGEYAAKKASFSTSEFATPHYSIGASDLYMQDITPRVESPAGAGQEFDPAKSGTAAGPKAYAFKAQNATIDFQGIPIFYWPYLAGDTSNNDIPLRKFKVSNSQTYGLSLETQWDLFALAGQKRPQDVKAALNLDEFSKRGPAGGVDAYWGRSEDSANPKTDDSFGEFRSYGLEDKGTDRLGRNRTDVPVVDDERGRVLARHQQDLGNGWTLNLEASYISDPNFLQQFFNGEYETDKEQETSFYIKHQGDTDAISLLGKFNLYDFTSVADQVDDQYTTEKKPEAKYWRIGDSFLDMFTYYSESGVANLHTSITDYTPAQLALTQSTNLPTFLGPPGAVLASNSTLAATKRFRDYYQQHGFLNDDVARADSRHELDMPFQVGDVKISPYITGRATAWDDGFSNQLDSKGVLVENDGNTTRLWGSGGVRSSMEFWRVYSDVDSTFWDVHQIRHVIEPQFNVFATGATQSRNDLQPFDRDVEGISRASGTSLSLDQKWQTKRGGPGHWRNVDWLTLNVQWNNFWDKERTGSFYYPLVPARGFYFASRPELSLVQNSVAVNGAWRIGERVRLLSEANYDTTDNRLYQGAAGIAVDQTSSLSYFFGNRYVEIPQFGNGLNRIPGYTSDEWTLAMDYQLTRKYELIASESYDVALSENILTSFTIVRKLPRFVTAITVTYDSNNADTTVSFSASPEGLPELGLGSGAANNFAGR